MNKRFPIAAFAAFFAAIAVATFHYAPSWGLMDDFQNLRLAKQVWASPQPLHELIENFMGGGVMRPFYFTWIALSYYIFQNWPAGFYVFNALCNMTAMLFWGSVLFHLFRVRHENYFWTVFFYPLTFFLFTAFWNIFNYLSLQEKFIVFFAPAAVYLFQKTYRDFRRADMVWLYIVVLLGLSSKATFIFVPFIFLVFALLDVVLFRYRPKLSQLFVIVNGLIFAAYAFFTFTFQLKQSYTEKYKANLGGGAFLDRLLHLSLVMKAMLLIGFVGAAAVIFYCIRRKKPELCLSVLVYLGLMTYVMLLLPWGSQSYLLSATGPLLMGALFPVYAWLNGKGRAAKIAVNGVIVGLLIAVFAGNIMPNISRMGDIAKAVGFVRGYANAADQYFMPPPFAESAYAFGNLTGKTVIFCQDNVLNEDELSKGAANYVLLSDLFPSIELSGVRLGREVYTNATWRIFEILSDAGHHENVALEFPKNPVQQLKIKIRNLY